MKFIFHFFIIFFFCSLYGSRDTELSVVVKSSKFASGLLRKLVSEHSGVAEDVLPNNMLEFFQGKPFLSFFLFFFVFFPSGLLQKLVSEHYGVAEDVLPNNMLEFFQGKSFLSFFSFFFLFVFFPSEHSGVAEDILPNNMLEFFQG